MKVKLLVLCTLITIITITTSISAFADSEHKYYDVRIDGSCNYGHVYIYGDFNVIYVLLDNGTQQAFVPIVFSDKQSDLEIEISGSSKNGTTIEQAKNLSDDNMESSVISDTVLLDNNMYLYNTWNINLLYYGVSAQRKDFYSDTEKYYYYNSSYDVLSQDMYVAAITEYFNNNLYSFDIVNDTYLESGRPLDSPSNVTDVDLLDCINIILQMFNKVVDLVLQSPFVYFLAIGLIVGAIGLFAKFRHSV